MKLLAILALAALIAGSLLGYWICGPGIVLWVIVVMALMGEP